MEKNSKQRLLSEASEQAMEKATYTDSIPMVNLNGINMFPWFAEYHWPKFEFAIVGKYLFITSHCEPRSKNVLPTKIIGIEANIPSLNAIKCLCSATFDKNEKIDSFILVILFIFLSLCEIILKIW